MSLSTVEREYLEAIVWAFKDEPTVCNDWEQKFMADMAGRLEKYAFNTSVSEAQWKVIKRIGNKYEIVASRF